MPWNIKEIFAPPCQHIDCVPQSLVHRALLFVFLVNGNGCLSLVVSRILQGIVFSLAWLSTGHGLSLERLRCCAKRPLGDYHEFILRCWWFKILKNTNKQNILIFSPCLSHSYFLILCHIRVGGVLTLLNSYLQVSPVQRHGRMVSSTDSCGSLHPPWTGTRPPLTMFFSSTGVNFHYGKVKHLVICPWKDCLLEFMHHLDSTIFFLSSTMFLILNSSNNSPLRLLSEYHEHLRGRTNEKWNSWSDRWPNQNS